jgi:serine/threonine protein kinase
MTGLRLGNWILGPELGRGAVGTVYRANSEDGTRTAAVKVLTHEQTRSPEFLQRFARDMLGLQRLDHPNIAKFYESGVHAGFAYYACELVEGTDCATLLRTSRRTEEPGLGWKERVVSIAVQCGWALKHGHHRTTLHRDLKPSNLMVTPEGVLKLTDFGVSKVLGISPLILPPDPLGSVGFLAPEFFNGKPITRRSDLYALGGVLYTLVTGRPPFAASTVSEFMHKHCYVLPDRPIQFVPKLLPDLDDAICAMLAKDPGRRPASAVNLIDILEHIRGKAERKGEVVVWPSVDGNQSAPMAALPDDSSQQETSRPPRPWLSRPAVVLPLFLLVLGLALALTFWPRPSAEQLFQQAQPLLESSNPDDWDRAWDEYLQPIVDHHPNRYAEELRAIRSRIRDRKRLRATLTEAAKQKPLSEGERIYQRGLALAGTGDVQAARRLWSSWLAMAEGTGSDRRWMDLTRDALGELDRRGISPADSTELLKSSSVQQGLERIQQLKQAGHGEAAEQLRVRLLALYADDPELLEMLRLAP